MGTPFENAGYTKDTKFKVLKDFGNLTEGDIVTLEEDDNSYSPYFRNEGGDVDEMYLPGSEWGKELEVYEDQSSGTPTQVTRDTKVSIELTLEEAIATYVVVGTVGGGSHFRNKTSEVYHKLQELLEPICETTDVISYLNISVIDADYPLSGSFETLLDAMLPAPVNTKKQEALKQAEELKKKLEELQKSIEEME